MNKDTKNTQPVEPGSEEDWKNRALRALADYQNLKKETEQARTEYAQFATADLISQLLPILDNFTAAVQYVPKEQQDLDWVVGVFHIQRQLEEVLKQQGVEAIDVVGQQFDPQQHEAVDQRHDPQVPDGQIVEQVQSGYRWHDKIVQPARVVVNVVGEAAEENNNTNS